jgi:hypothetical protein
VEDLVPVGPSAARVKARIAGLFFCVCLGATVSVAQDLTPRAYIITPIHTNAVTLTFSFLNGGVLFNPTLPISDVTANSKMQIFSYFHTMDFLGRSANIAVVLPYGAGNFQGKSLGTQQEVYRSGASLTVLAPTGQYDAQRLINQGNNRWAFKPEIGFSRRWGHWVLDAYGAVWFFTTNPEYFSNNDFSPGINTLDQKPIGAFEGHLSYDVRERLWASLDGNFWYGGNTVLNGVEVPDSRQANSRIGGSVSVPLSRHQSLKFSFNSGVYIHLGGDYNTVSVSWQYSWLGRPN